MTVRAPHQGGHDRPLMRWAAGDSRAHSENEAGHAGSRPGLMMSAPFQLIGNLRCGGGLPLPFPQFHVPSSRIPALSTWPTLPYPTPPHPSDWLVMRATKDPPYLHLHITLSSPAGSVMQALLPPTICWAA